MVRTNTKEPQPVAHEQPGAGLPSWASMAALAVSAEALLIVSMAARLEFANQAALRDLEAGRYFMLTRNVIQPRNPDLRLAWPDMLRQLSGTALSYVELDPGSPYSTVAMRLIMPPEQDGELPLALIGMGRPRLCTTQALEHFITRMSITPAETLVLEYLLSGVPPNSIAVHLEISPHTVRKHILRMVEKTGSNGIRPLLARLSRLPGLEQASFIRPNRVGFRGGRQRPVARLIANSGERRKLSSS